MIDFENNLHLVVVISNFSFLLPCLFFLRRFYTIIIDCYQNVSIKEKIVYCIRIYLMQLFVTLLTIFNSVNYHIHEGNQDLRCIDFNSVSLCLSVNFAFLICDDLYLKNALDLYFVSMKIIGYFLQKTNQFEFTEIPLMLFIIIAIKRRHIISLDLKLFCFTLLSMVWFFVSSLTEFSAISIENQKNVYMITHSLWHIFIGITYYIALRNIKHYNNTDLLTIERAYIFNHNSGTIINTDFLEI